MGSGLIASPRATRPAKIRRARSNRLFCRATRRSSLKKQNWSIFDIGDEIKQRQVYLAICFRHPFSDSERNQAERAISTGKLNALPRLHIRPIDVVVFHGPSGRSGFEAGFPLRCLQRLSIPYIATLHRGWRHDRSTRDTFTPVLSY